MKKFAVLVVALAAGGTASAFGGPGEFLVVPDSSNDILVTFNPFDGSLINSNFATIAGGTPKHALQVGNEIWVSNQLNDNIDRFSLGGSFISSIGGALDNIKGMAVVGNEVWVTNAGSNNGANGNSIVRVDINTATVSGFSPTNGSLFDLVNYQDRLLGSNIGEEDLEFYDNAGALSGVFHASDGVSGIDFPQQLFVRENGGILAAGFSPTSGVYAYDSDGNDLGIVAGLDGGARGVYELGNGNIMWTNGGGVWVTDPNSGQTFNVYDGGSAQYIDFVAIPAPGTLGLFALAGFASRRRRR